VKESRQSSASQLPPALLQPQAQRWGSLWDLLIARFTVEDLVTSGGYGLSESVMDPVPASHHQQQGVGVEAKRETVRGRSGEGRQRSCRLSAVLPDPEVGSSCQMRKSSTAGPHGLSSHATHVQCTCLQKI